jgi:hypothetical protein
MLFGGVILPNRSLALHARSPRHFLESKSLQKCLILLVGAPRFAFASMNHCFVWVFLHEPPRLCTQSVYQGSSIKPDRTRPNLLLGPRRVRL